MERLTAYNSENHKNVAYYKACFEYPCNGFGCKIDGCKLDYEICQRLSAYEDTGLEPEEIADFMKRWEQAVEIGGMLKKYGIDHIWDIIQAEQNGKLVVIPWAAGDVIYEADPAHGVVKHTFAGEPAWMMHSYAVDDAGNEWYDGWGSSDETPFYKTREEAEAALKGGDDNA